jgi:RP/EB family microtubule-associated protein
VLLTCAFRSDYEFIGNYKLLQAAFTKNRVQRHVDVDKLIRAKYQDNLEFCQWLKAFYDQSGAVREDYDPNAIRARGKGGKKFNELLQKTAAKHGSKPLPAARNRRVTPTPASASSPRIPIASRPAPQRRPVPTKATTTTRSTGPRPTPTLTKAPSRPAENKRTVNTAAKVEADAQMMKKNAEMAQVIEDLEASVVELEKERDFYFGKLRNVELMLQVQQDNNFDGCDTEGVVANIFKVLYATAEEDVEVGDDGEVSSFMFFLKHVSFSKISLLMCLDCTRERGPPTRYERGLPTRYERGPPTRY